MMERNMYRKNKQSRVLEQVLIGYVVVVTDQIVFNVQSHARNHARFTPQNVFLGMRQKVEMVFVHAEYLATLQMVFVKWQTPLAGGLLKPLSLFCSYSHCSTKRVCFRPFLWGCVGLLEVRWEVDVSYDHSLCKNFV